ncbi:hypothetical protein LTR85_006821 [Meristemomyces frigidus]|nr:hypothetical protein LTR85_006821 [Meristemomyces frigidus]
MTELDIANWVMDRFPYYNNLARKQFCHPTHAATAKGWKRACVGDCCFPEKISAAFSQFEVPVKAVEMEPGEDSDSELPDANEQHWITSTSEARIFLRSTLHAASTGTGTTQHFSFLKLPAELRQNIYELALGFPRSGVYFQYSHRFGHPPKPESLYTRTRDYEATLEVDGDEDTKDDIEYAGELRCPPTSEVLALLQANKQIHREAVAVFYSINTFIGGSVRELYNMLATMPEDRRKHVGHIKFTYHVQDAGIAPSSFRLLKNIEHLRRLDITIYERIWLEEKNWKGKQVYPSIEKLPGLATLRSVRGLRALAFHGDCENFKAYLEPEMMKVKPKKRAVATAKKRKGGQDAGEGVKEGEPARKVKKARSG